LQEAAVQANEFCAVFTRNVLAGHQYSAAERKEIDTLLRQRERVLARITKIEATLVAIQKDGATIKKHCNTSPAELQAAIREYQKKLHDAEVWSSGWNLCSENRSERPRLSCGGCRFEEGGQPPLRLGAAESRRSAIVALDISRRDRDRA
jgi:hypothetical protein